MKVNLFSVVALGTPILSICCLAAAQNANIDTKQSALLSDGNTTRVITIEDARHMRKALLAGLRASKLGDRSMLIAFSEPLPAWIDIDGKVRISGWLLEFQRGSLFASYRMAQNKQSAYGFAAYFSKLGQDWKVTSIVPFEIRQAR